MGRRLSFSKTENLTSYYKVSILCLDNGVLKASGRDEIPL